MKKQKKDLQEKKELQELEAFARSESSDNFSDLWYYLEAIKTHGSIEVEEAYWHEK